MLCWGGVLPFTASFTAARETHSRTTANFILPIDCTDSAADQTIVNSLSHAHTSTHTHAGTCSPAGCITSRDQVGPPDGRRRSEKRRLVSGFAKHGGGHRRLVCLHLHLCCCRFLAVALLFGMALHVFACVCVCLRRCGISGASPK